jgi:hypothetical protein
MRSWLLAGACLALLAAGAARAEPVALPTDQMDEVTAGTLVGPDFSLTVYKNLVARVDKDISIRALVFVAPFIKGNLADAEAKASALGRDSYSETLTFADVVEGLGSQSASHSVAASSRHAIYEPK